LFPIVQDQWLNIFLLNKIEFSYYQILYFLSGLFFPVIVITNSLRNFQDYKFLTSKFKNKQFKYISYPIIFIILVFSILITNYFIFTIKFIFSQIDSNILFDVKLQVLSSLTVAVLLLIKKTKSIIKKCLLTNFFIICFLNWSIYFSNLVGIEIYNLKYFSEDNYFYFKNIFLLNIIYLYILEIFYYICSFLTYKNNISDWCIPYPMRSDLKPLLKLNIFYIGVIIYYIIFNRIS